MKQITQKQLEALALADPREVETWTEYSASDWIKENAHHIAAIESGRTSKTLFGEWPKGWKAEMKRAAKEKAKADLIARFKRQNIMEMDGALWLNNHQLIQQLAEKAA
jgi:hypothetical protein